MCRCQQLYSRNRIWTFHSSDTHVGVQSASFVALIGLAMNNALIYLLNERRKMPFYVSKGIATGIVMLWNFGANYLFTFSV